MRTYYQSIFSRPAETCAAMPWEHNIGRRASLTVEHRPYVAHVHVRFSSTRCLEKRMSLVRSPRDSPSSGLHTCAGHANDDSLKIGRDTVAATRFIHCPYPSCRLRRQTKCSHAHSIPASRGSHDSQSSIQALLRDVAQSVGQNGAALTPVRPVTASIGGLQSTPKFSTTMMR